MVPWKRKGLQDIFDMSAAIYARVSTISQVDGFGIKSQISKCETLAMIKGWNVVKIYKDEAVSGVKESRPALDEMFETMKSDGFNMYSVIIVKNINRLGRDARLILDIIKRIEDCGLCICTCEGNMDTTTPMGKFMMHTMAGIAELERANIIARTTAGRNERALRDGDKGGRMPYGYLRQKINGKDIVEIDPIKAKIVRLVFRLRDKKYSLRKIASIINSKGVNKSKWYAGTVNGILNNKHKYGGCKRGESNVSWPVIFVNH